MNKAIFIKTERLPIASLKAPKPLQKKPLPRYMQANIAWLSKDKTTDSSAAVEQSQRSRRSSIYHSRSLLRQKSEVSRMLRDFDFDDEPQAIKVSNQVKHIVINRDDPDIQDYFKRVC